MREIGVRELKSSLSATLRAVGAGEHVRVTSRGRVVAEIVPAGGVVDPLQQLVDEGRITRPTRVRAPAPPLVHAARSASAVVLAERDAAR